MSKLLKLKKWLTLQEVINHISSSVSETVTEADIYRWALEKHLTLSVNFVNETYAYLGLLDTLQSLALTELETEMIEKGYVLNLLPSMDTTKVRSITGVWDLTLIGSEKVDLGWKYQQLVSDIELTAGGGSEGVYVKKDGVIAELLTDFDDNEYQEGSKAQCEYIEDAIDHKNTSTEEIAKIRQAYNEDRVKYLDSRKGKANIELYFPSASLDEHDYMFVVRKSELNRFLRDLDDESVDAIQNTTDPKFNFSEEITNTDTWQNLYKLTEKALKAFPDWRQSQRKPNSIQKSHIDEWLMETLKTTKREAETIKKIIIEIFKI
jgi:hypothetical protein